MALIVAGASIVSACVALAGIYIGRRLEVKAERDRASQDRRIATYQELIKQYFRLREAIRRVATSEPDPENRDPRTEEARNVGIDWNSAVFDVWLYGSRAVADHVRDLDENINSLFVDARANFYTTNEWQDAREKTQRLMDSYLDVVRTELDLPPHKIISDYKR